MRISLEQWLEIDKVRTRLEEYKAKIHPYPNVGDWNSLTESEPEIQLLFKPRSVDKEIDHLKTEVQYLFNKLTELRAKKLPPPF